MTEVLPQTRPATITDAVREALISLRGIQRASSVLKWIHQHHGGQFPDRLVGTNLRGCSVNQPSAIARHPNFPRFIFNCGPGLFEVYDPERHGLFDEHGYEIEDRNGESLDPTTVGLLDRSTISLSSLAVPPEAESLFATDLASSDHDFQAITEEFEGRRQFAYEAHLRDYLARNLELLEAGLTHWTASIAASVEYGIEGRRVDILAKDSEGTPVVIELKLNKGHDRVIGQAFYYRAALRKELGISRVRIFLVAAEISRELRVACSEVEDVVMFEYSLEVKVKRVLVPGD